MGNDVIALTWTIEGVTKQVSVYPNGKRRFIFYEPFESFYNADITNMDGTLYDELIAEALECKAVLIRVPITAKAQYLNN